MMKRLMLMAALAACGSKSASSEPEVRAITEPGYCEARGFCASTKPVCEMATNSTCSATSAYACMKYTTRTADLSVPMCWATYGQCKQFEADKRRDPETKSIDENCVIYRRSK